MNKKQRILIKTFYYIIGIIIDIFVCVKYTELFGMIGFSYIIFGSILSIALKLPLLSSSVFSVDKNYYNNIDTFINILMIILSMSFMTYLYIM